MRNYIPDLEIHSFEPILEELDKQRKILGKADVFLLIILHLETLKAKLIFILHQEKIVPQF